MLFVVIKNVLLLWYIVVQLWFTCQCWTLLYFSLFVSVLNSFNVFHLCEFLDTCLPVVVFFYCCSCMCLYNPCAIFYRFSNQLLYLSCGAYNAFVCTAHVANAGWRNLLLIRKPRWDIAWIIYKSKLWRVYINNSWCIFKMKVTVIVVLQYSVLVRDSRRRLA